jgi:ubiquinone/menaquinone biosynthesis C-methylase UbiE
MAERPSFYVADAENIIEMVRLIEQDRLITDRVSGLLPPDVRPETVQQVLDIGCGPGGWVLDMAKAYPALQVTGIDISDVMIDYATKRAIAEGVDNAYF